MKNRTTIWTLLKLHWSPQNVLPADSYTVDIILREYNYTSREWVFTDIAKRVSSTGYIEVAVPNFISLSGYNNSATSALIQIRVNGFFSGIQNDKHRWLPIIKNIGTMVLDFLLRAGCELWEQFQSRQSAQQTLVSLPPCPCTESEIREKRSVFEEQSHASWNFHPGSRACFRQRNS